MKHVILEILREYILEDKKKWTKEMVHKIALDYKTKTEFNTFAKAAYLAAKRYGWFEEVTSHMISPIIRWNREMIEAEAKKYKTKSGFRKGSPKAYGAAEIRGILADVTKHMVPVGDLFKRLVYVYEFPDKTAYVGLTHDKDERDSFHRIKGPIFEYIRQTGLEPELKLVSADYINASDAQILEACTIELYKKNGWKLLNKAKAGSLGMCGVFWTKEKVQNEANKYTRRIDFQNNSSKAYNAALRNGWLDEVCDHMPQTHIDWTLDKVREEAKKYTDFTDFRKNSSLAYGAAYRNGWLDEISSHMEKKLDRWTEDSLIKEMGKYKSISELRNNNGGAYTTAYNLLGSKFINDFYGSTANIMWTLDLLKKEASKYKTRLDFLRGSESAYKAAERQGILQDLLKDMEPDFQWTEDKVREESKKYKTRMDFKKGSKTAYNYAIKWGILDDLIPSLRKRQ